MPKNKKMELDTVVPPLHQSTRILTSCPKFYVTATIEGRKKPSGPQANRGTQFHRVLSNYSSHCANKGVSMDVDAFDRFATAVGPTAAKILSGLKESYSVDHEHLFATEITMRLDENLNPTQIDGPLEGSVEGSGRSTHYEGTLDALYLYHEEGKALIDDAKTHARPFDPRDAEYALQGQMYSLFVMQFFPWVEKVKFRLWFVRYKNLFREVEYTRKDLPSLKEFVKTARSLQLSIHEDYNKGFEIKAIGNDNCLYCPLLSNRECPILQDNEYAHGTPQEWVSTSLVYSAYAKVNNARMKAWVQANGKPIILKDYNGKAYSYGPEESVSDVLPLFEATADGIVMDREGNPSLPIVSLLLDYAHATPDDVAWMGKIQISSSSFSSYLKAKSRVNIHQAIQDAAEKVTKVKLKVSKPLDVLPPDEEEETEENEFGEDTEF